MINLNQNKFQRYLSTACVISYLIIFLSLAQSQAVAESSSVILMDNQFQYAESLFADSDYMRAITEYKRFVYFYPKDKRRSKTEYKIGMSYFFLKNFETALDQFIRVVNTSGMKEYGFKSHLMISRCYQELNDYNSAILILQQLNQASDDPQRNREIKLLLGWLYIDKGDFSKARTHFEHMDDTDYTGICDQLTKNQRAPYKSPIMAGLFSIIPGGGYLYCGRYRDAMISFLINGVLIFAAYESFDENLNALGGAISAIELGFYSGNIIGSVSSADKHNHLQKRRFIEKLKTDFSLQVSLLSRSNGPQFYIAYHF